MSWRSQSRSATGRSGVPDSATPFHNRLGQYRSFDRRSGPVWLDSLKVRGNLPIGFHVPFWRLCLCLAKSRFPTPYEAGIVEPVQFSSTDPVPAPLNERRFGQGPVIFRGAVSIALGSIDLR
jgi:hypothetical protein